LEAILEAVDAGVGQRRVRVGRREGDSAQREAVAEARARGRVGDAQPIAAGGVEADAHLGRRGHVSRFRHIEPQPLHEAVARPPLAAGEVAQTGVGIALSHQRARLAIDQVDEQQVVARRLAGHFPVEVDADRLAGADGGCVDGVAAQPHQRVELDVNRVGQRRALGPGCRRLARR